MASAINRTSDVICDLNVLLLQYYTWTKLPDEIKNSAEDSIDPQNIGQENLSGELSLEDLKCFVRFWVEENRRRKLPKDSQPLTKTEILDLLYAENKQFVRDYQTALIKRDRENESSQGSEIACGAAYAAYHTKAEKLRSRVKNSEEEKK